MEQTNTHCYNALPFGWDYRSDMANRMDGINFKFVEGGLVKSQRRLSFALRDPAFDRT